MDLFFLYYLFFRRKQEVKGSARVDLNADCPGTYIPYTSSDKGLATLAKVHSWRSFGKHHLNMVTKGGG